MKFPVKKQCPFLSEEDILLGLRYAYYVNNISAVPDMVYDKWEKRCLGSVSKDSLLRKPGSDNKEDYPDRIRALGMYFTFLMVKKEGDDNAKRGLSASASKIAALKFKPKSAANKKIIEVELDPSDRVAAFRND